MNTNECDTDANLITTGLDEICLQMDDNGNDQTNIDGAKFGSEGEDEDEDEEEVEYVESEEDTLNRVDGRYVFNSNEDGIVINDLDDIYNIKLDELTVEDVGRLDFVDLEVAYLFYCWYARINGFSVRRSHIVRNKHGETLQQTFVCSREGFRKNKGATVNRKKRRSKKLTRCGCEAMFRAHVNTNSGRWYVTVFSFDHNHVLLDLEFSALLPAHRKMNATDVMQIENYRKVGIRPPHIYAAFANNCGGFEKVGWVMKDLYNQVSRQRQEESSDVRGAFKFFQELSSSDPLLFVSYTLDDDRRLQHLFWADGESQMNYELFGDVLAFDATYKKNKYLCPFVVFSGVNHHNHTVVFAAALVTNETEDTYVWLLEQFLEAMKGKAPSSIITDGDVAMKNAIRKVFPNVHHRLCTWHLLRNANCHLRNRECLQRLKKCMLGDFDIDEFEEHWSEMVATFGLENNQWITELYEKRRKWSPAYIRGNFFAGIRTTSRCEAFHSHCGRYLHSRINLTDFVQQFHLCLTYFRYREVEADYFSKHGDEKLETNYHSLERSADAHMTKELFLLFRPYLNKASFIRVVDCQEMAMSSVFTVLKYRTNKTWNVSHCPMVEEFRCSCLRMESFGLPCEHIIAVLLHLHYSEFPKSLLCQRWSKHAKDAIRGLYTDGSTYWDSYLFARYSRLVAMSRQVCEYAYREEGDYDDTIDLLSGQLTRLKLKYSSTATTSRSQNDSEVGNDDILDPPLVRHKGCGSSTNSQGGSSKRAQTCSKCGERGHNKRSCTAVNGTSNPVSGTPVIPSEQ